jgi:hypothetical protein
MELVTQYVRKDRPGTSEILAFYKGFGIYSEGNRYFNTNQR